MTTDAGNIELLRGVVAEAAKSWGETEFHKRLTRILATIPVAAPSSSLVPEASEPVARFVFVSDASGIPFAPVPLWADVGNDRAMYNDQSPRGDE